MKQKGILLSAAAFILVLLGFCVFLTLPARNPLFSPDNPKVLFRSHDKKIQSCENGQWQDFRITGVNIGTGYPGLFPNDPGIEPETYLRWFQMIAEMNANTVRVYKLQPPEFYEAFAAYNRSHSDKLYLIQGMDFPEQLMYTERNLLEPEVHEELFRDSFRMVDALHGNQFIFNIESRRLDCYLYDVSDYVLGYILGIEWDEMFVDYLCRINAGTPLYQGEFLRCSKDASPFESFLAEWGGRILAYENDKYNMQHLMSFCNWPETDPFLNELDLADHHTGEQPNTEVRVDPEHILSGDRTESGIFASYNVYPYFPSFLQHGRYAELADAEGNFNPYRTYLTELAAYHSMPVIITEYGVPASRSSAYDDIWHNISHGGLNETQQGEAILTLYEDIVHSGCAGSIVFTWQDEWYKTIWNEKIISDPDRRANWSNAQCAEQFFGLLAFEPGTPEEIVYPDGDLSEWEESDRLPDSGPVPLRIRSDEKYLYLLAEELDRLPPGDSLCIALDITPKSGRTENGRNSFSRPVDFIIELSPEGTASIRVDTDYDILAYSALGGYHDTTVDSLKNLTELHIPKADSPFVPIFRAGGDIHGRLQSRWKLIPAGTLISGNANPASPDFQSNADYFRTETAAEIRIPWQLLNFRDPSQGLIADDLRENDCKLNSLAIDEIYAAAYPGSLSRVDAFGAYRLKKWNVPQWHERLKQSYFILQKAFQEGVEHDHS